MTYYFNTDLISISSSNLKLNLFCSQESQSFQVGKPLIYSWESPEKSGVNLIANVFFGGQFCLFYPVNISLKYSFMITTSPTFQSDSNNYSTNRHIFV